MIEKHSFQFHNLSFTVSDTEKFTAQNTKTLPGLKGCFLPVGINNSLFYIDNQRKGLMRSISIRESLYSLLSHTCHHAYLFSQKIFSDLQESAGNKDQKLSRSHCCNYTDQCLTNFIAYLKYLSRANIKDTVQAFFGLL